MTDVTRRFSGWPGGIALVGTFAVAVGVALSGLMDQTAIGTRGPVASVVGLAGIGIVVGVAGRPTRWWATWGVGIALASTVVVASANWWILESGLVSAHYPPVFLFWAWLGVWAIGVGLTGWWSGGAAIRVTRVLAAPMAVLAAFLVINAHYGYWPTMGVLLGRPVAGQVSAPVVYKEIQQRSASQKFVETNAKARLPRTGLYGPIAIPADPVYFAARSAWVWLPPAYFRSPDRQLPVLIMLTGVPGDAQDWVTAGQVVSLANSWAYAHDGVAPVMVFLNENGRGDHDTECVNGPQGAAESYLAVDLPAWIEHTLGIRPNPSTWGVIGFSEGGTCAIGLAIENPQVFGTFVDIGGDMAPNLGRPAATLKHLYGGSAVEARAFDPSSILATHRYRHLDGWFAAGSADHAGLVAARALAVLAADAGITVHTYQGSGDHTWAFARRSLTKIYPTLARGMHPA